MSESTWTMVIGYVLSDVDIRRTAIELERCFLSGSVVDGCLQSSKSVAFASYMSQEFTRFSLCYHSPPRVCDECRNNLLMACNSAQQIIPSVSYLGAAMASSIVLSERAKLKELSYNIALVINKCICTHGTYHQLFDENQTKDIRAYNHNHMSGNGLPHSDY